MTFDNVSLVMTVKKSVKKLCCKFRVFVLLIKPVAFYYCILLFSHFRSLRRGFLSSLVVNGRGKRRSPCTRPYQNTNVNEFETKAKYSGESRRSDKGGGGRGGRWGGGHPDHEIRGWPGLKKIFFGPSGLILV